MNSSFIKTWSNCPSVTQGNSYRLRLVNQAVDHVFTFTMDGHPFDVIATDFVPTYPRKNLTSIVLNIGQRYDIVFNATQAVGNYWMRVNPGCAFGGRSKIYDAGIVVGGVLHYSGASTTADPTSTAFPQPAGSCDDEFSTPYWNRTVPQPSGFTNPALGIAYPKVIQQNNATHYVWTINQSSMQVNWAMPTLEYVLEGRSDFPATENLYQLNGGDTTWVYWVIQQATPVPHPIHLHGHDFWVLGSGAGAFDNTTTSLQFNNPRRRDTAILPGGGHLVIAFVTDNPGAWLMHCHIGWHVSGGLSLQFLERPSEIKTSIPSNQFDGFTQGCTAWKQAVHPFAIDDSGL